MVYSEVVDVIAMEFGLFLLTLTICFSLSCLYEYIYLCKQSVSVKRLEKFNNCVFIFSRQQLMFSNHMLHANYRQNSENFLITLRFYIHEKKESVST